MAPSAASVRRAAVLLGVTAVVGLLTGCSKVMDGAVGIGPDEGGTVTVQLVTCTYPATEVQLLLDDGLEQVAEAPLAQESGTSSRYPLAELFGTDVVEGLDPGVDYRLRGRVSDEDGTRFTHGATFSLDEVATYPSGQVSGNDIDGLMAREAFAMQACVEENSTDRS